MRAADFHEVKVHRVESEGVDVVSTQARALSQFEIRDPLYRARSQHSLGWNSPIRASSSILNVLSGPTPV